MAFYQLTVERDMKKFPLLAVLVSSIVMLTAANAQVPKNQRYCAMFGSGTLNCHWETMEQCRRHANKTITSSCMLNPALANAPKNKKSN
jgi:hypothetical protein